MSAGKTTEDLIKCFRKISYQGDLTKARSMSKKGMITYEINPSWINNENDKGWRPRDCKKMCFLYDPEDNRLPFAVFCDTGFYEIEFSIKYPNGRGILLSKYE